MQKTKALSQLEERMEGLNPGSFRWQTLDAARRFKSSWIELGRYLVTVYRDKMFKEWGYLTFEAYCAKEVGVRQATAVKLLKSYSFLEKDEPEFLRRSALDDKKPNQIPGFESVNALRLAKESGRVSGEDYEALRQTVLDGAAGDEEVKKKIRYVLKTGQKDRLLPEEQKKELVKKFSLYLQNAKTQAQTAGLPGVIIKKIDELLRLLADF